MAARKNVRISRTLLWVAGFASLALVAGFTLGALTIGGFTSAPQQATATGVTSPPTGLSFPLVEATLVTGSSTPGAGACTVSNLGTKLSPTPLTDGTNTTICLSTSGGGFALGDILYILDVAFASTAAVSTTFEIQVFLSVTPSASDIVQTAYVQTSATIATGETATLAVDLTQASGTSLNGFAIIATQL